MESSSFDGYAPTSAPGSVPVRLASDYPLEPTTAKTFGPRAAAYLIDIAVIAGLVRLMGLTSFPLISPVLGLFGYQLFAAETGQSVPGLQLLDRLLTSTMYFALFEWLFGASLGKLILGMRVVRMNGEACTLWAALVRGVLRLIDGFVFGIPAASSMSGNPALQQRLGDKAARTVVVDRRDPFIRRSRAPWRAGAALVSFVVAGHLWLVIYLIGTGETFIAPRFLPLNAPAASLNVQAGDLNPALDLSDESGLADFTNFDGTDINERLFADEEAAVQSRVALFDFRLSDTIEDLAKSGETALQREFEGEQLTLESSQTAAIGEQGVVRKFANAEAEAEGYLLMFRRQNAYVRLIFYGPAGRFTSDQVLSVARNVDNRLISAGRQGR